VSQIHTPAGGATVRQRGLHSCVPTSWSAGFENASTPLAPLTAPNLLHALLLSDFDHADRIGEFWGYPESRALAELLIDCEEDRTLRAVLIEMLREI
jgi:hypothetical protein